MADSGRNEAILRVSDCSEIAEVELAASSDGSRLTLVSEQARRLDSGSLACEFSLPFANAPALDIEATLRLGNGDEHGLAESYLLERNRPDIALEAISVQSDEKGGQTLLVSLAVTEDVDISHLDVTVSALRASDLRSANGVVEEAMDTAFASTDGAARRWPTRDEQGLFHVLLPIDSPLSDAEILRNGLVLVDAVAVDASGNVGGFSTISLTGESVSESALSLQVVPSELLFTDLFESAVLLPQVDFEFRGVTTLAGAGMGVTYSSSHPDIVAVTDSGTVLICANLTNQTRATPSFLQLSSSSSTSPGNRCS